MHNIDNEINYSIILKLN